AKCAFGSMPKTTEAPERTAWRSISPSPQPKSKTRLFFSGGRTKRITFHRSEWYAVSLSSSYFFDLVFHHSAAEISTPTRFNVILNSPISHLRPRRMRVQVDPTRYPP